MLSFKLFLENKNLEVIKELYYKGMLGMQELYEVPEFANYIDSLSDSELEKDVETIWDKFVSLVKKGKIKIKSKIEDFIKKYNVATEDLVTFGNIAYPKFNQVVILAGGGGSGKGFVQSNLLGIEGKVFDVDAIKSTSLGLQQIKDEVSSKYGINKNLPLDKFRKEALKNPDVVKYLHFRLGDGNKEMGIKGMNMEQTIKYTLYRTVLSADADRKPNLIFDSTTKRLEKVYEIAEYCISLGYNPEDIHLVWIFNDVKVAMKNNYSRARQVPTDTLFETHIGAAGTMIDIIKNSEKVEGIIDGDIWIVFNQADVDVRYENPELRPMKELIPLKKELISLKKKLEDRLHNLTEIEKKDLNQVYKDLNQVYKEINAHEVIQNMSSIDMYVGSKEIQGSYIKYSLNLKIKSKGKPMLSEKQINDIYVKKLEYNKLNDEFINIFDKINSYVPQNREYFIDIKKKDGSEETKYFKYEKDFVEPRI